MLALYRNPASRPSTLSCHSLTCRSLAALAAISLFAMALAGCGGSRSATPPASNSVAAVAAGNWSITASAFPDGSQMAPLRGSLVQSASGLTGIFRAAAASACLPVGTNLLLSGEMSKTGHLDLVSAATNGTIWSFSGQVASDGRSIANGSVRLSGAGCPTDPAPATGTQYTPISGVYTGSFIG